MTQGNDGDMQQGSDRTEEDRRPKVTVETWYPYCHVDTTASAFVHPEFGTRYCSAAHAHAHVGVAAWYTLHEDWRMRDDLPRGPWRALDVPEDVPAQPCAAPSGFVDGADVVRQVLAGMAREAYPTHCATCTKALDTTPDAYGRPIDARNAEYPYCRGCHHAGLAFNAIHADWLGILHAYGLRTHWWNTGGGCWILVVQRVGAPDSWAEQEDGTFEPFVGIMGAHHDGTEWHVESGEIERGETLGAVCYPSEDHWCGELGCDVPQVAGVSVHDLAAFALAHLPA